MEIEWNGKTYDVTTLLPLLKEATRPAVAMWNQFSESHDYRMWLTADERALLVLPRTHKKVKAWLELIHKTCEFVDRSIPVPAPPPQTPDKKDEPPMFWFDAEGRFEVDGRKLDEGTVILLETRDKLEYLKMIDFIVAADPSVADLLEPSRQAVGFVSEKPWVGAWLAGSEDLEEWSPENELVHRLAHLLLIRRFGSLPLWLKLGYAWAVEIEVRKSIWCFPYRNEFVFEVEHTRWESDLRRWFQRRAERPLEMAEILALKRGSWNPEASLLAYGLTAFLMRAYPQELPKVIEALRIAQRRSAVRFNPDGTWTASAESQLDGGIQQEILSQLASRRFLEELGEFWRTGKRPSN